MGTKPIAIIYHPTNLYLYSLERKLFTGFDIAAFTD